MDNSKDYSQYPLQKDRVYELVLGDASTGNGVKITQLHIEFEVSLSANQKAKPNSASVTVYNMSDESLKIIGDRFVTCTLSVGYLPIGMQQVLAGNVTNVETKRQGVDKISVFTLGESFSNLNHTKTKGTIPEGATVRTVIEKVREQMGDVAQGVYSGDAINTPLPYGFPMNGTPREVLDRLTRTYGLEYQLDNKTLHITDKNGLKTTNPAGALLLSKDTGLVNRPEECQSDVTNADGKKVKKETGELTDKGKPKKETVKEDGLNVTMLLNPTISPASLIKLESQFHSGYYRAKEVKHYGEYEGNNWYTDVLLTRVNDIVGG